MRLSFGLGPRGNCQPNSGCSLSSNIVGIVYTAFLDHQCLAHDHQFISLVFFQELTCVGLQVQSLSSEGGNGSDSDLLRHGFLGGRAL